MANIYVKSARWLWGPYDQFYLTILFWRPLRVVNILSVIQQIKYWPRRIFFAERVDSCLKPHLHDEIMQCAYRLLFVPFLPQSFLPLNHWENCHFLKIRILGSGPVLIAVSRNLPFTAKYREIGEYPRNTEKNLIFNFLPQNYHGIIFYREIQLFYREIRDFYSEITAKFAILSFSEIRNNCFCTAFNCFR